MLKNILIEDISKYMGFECTSDLKDKKFNGNFQIDSRNIKRGDIFVALDGSNTNGLDFQKQALEKGAVAIISNEKIKEKNIRPKSIHSGNQNIIEGLNNLAKHNINKLKASGLKIVAITGSVGKTTTKDYLNSLLQQIGSTIAPEGSFNNELGTPLTILKANEKTNFLILEMGAKNIGDIANLVTIAKPDIGIITEISESHMESFKTLENIAKAKSEIIEKLPESKLGGYAVLNFDNLHIQKISNITKANLVKVGSLNDSDSKYFNLESKDYGYVFELDYQVNRNKHNLKIETNIKAKHLINNFALALTTSIILGFNPEKMDRNFFKSLSISDHRMKVFYTKNNNTIIDDGYNSNPTSLLAAITFLKNEADRNNKTPYLIMGEMLELGKNSFENHIDIIQKALNLKLKKIILIGESELVKKVFKYFKSNGINNVHYSASKAEAKEYIDSLDLANSIILFKASNSIKIWTLAEEYLEDLQERDL